MLHRIGKIDELLKLDLPLPEEVSEEVFSNITLMDSIYGADRNYLEVGGYSMIAETENDIAAIKAVLNYDTHPCEWARYIDDFICALYVMNNDFSIMTFMPESIAPHTILNDLEGEQK